MVPYVTKVNTLPADQFCVPDFTDVESSSSLETTQSLELPPPPPPVNYFTYPSTPHWLDIYNDTPSLLTYYNAVNPCEVRSSIYCVEIISILQFYNIIVFIIIIKFSTNNNFSFQNTIERSFINCICIYLVNVKYNFIIGNFILQNVKFLAKCWSQSISQ